MKVPAPNEVELIVTTEPDPLHEFVAETVEKSVTTGWFAIETGIAVVATELLPHDTIAR